LSSPAAPDPESLIAEALRLLGEGDLAGAELACRNALARSPKHGAASTVMAAILLSQARYGEAESAFSDLIEREPDEPTHWSNLGTARRGLKEFDRALVAYTKAASLGANDADFYFNVGLTHLDRADFESARSTLDQARNLAPHIAGVRLAYAQACYRLLQNDAAIAALADWRSMESMNPGILAQMAQLLVNLGAQAEGELALEAALADPAANAVTLLSGIETFERINRLDEARSLIARLENASRSSVIDEDLLVIRARLAQRAGEHAEAERLYGQALLGIEDPALKYTELFPLAQSLDALGRYEEAWAALREAHASQLDFLRRVAPTLALSGGPPMLITQHGCDPEDVAAWQDDAPAVEDSPVFIIAFPRSGTTLLEITLDAHPNLQSMDEQPFIQNALEEIRESVPDYPRALAGLSRRDLAEMRARYWRRVAGRIQLKPDGRLVDKNPLNILRLPVIRRLFPNSPILLGVRHPCDVILSCYMQLFRAPEFALLCNTPLGVARGYRRTMDFWLEQSQLLRPRSHEVRYESLVSNFEAEVRRIMTFLELPWDDRVLRPAQHAQKKGFISTPSYAQVVRQVSTSSVDRWRHYERGLLPVIPIVQPQLERWDYSAVVTVDGVSPNNR
jgi:tetratricopeptide (TPR) repeat protein